MVVVPEPAVKGGGALFARAVDRAVGPAGEQRADEALRLAVRLRSVGTSTAVLDPEPPAGERVRDRDIRGAVVCEQPLDADAVATEEGERPAQEADRRHGLLVRQDLGVGEAAVVVDRDVHELPADRVPAVAVEVGEGGPVVALAAAEDALADAALDAPEAL